MQIIIVAGGGGSRLWPASNPKVPKQFVKIVGNKSSLEHVYEYLSAAFDPGQIWINTNHAYSHQVLELIPGFNPHQLLLEPEKRDNFAAVSTQAAILSHKFGEDEPLVFVTSDEFMLENESIAKYQEAIRKIGKALEERVFEVVTMGVRPIAPNVNYGYLELDLVDYQNCYSEIVRVNRFCEKPDLEKAKQFLDKGNYIWNKFNPSFCFKTLKKYLSSYDPASLEILVGIEKTGVVLHDDYSKLPKTSFDYAFMEKAPEMGVIGLDIDDWVDIGSWGIAKKYLPDLSKNQIELAGHGNKAVLSNPNQKVAFVGVSNLMLVETEEGILILDPEQSALVKQASEYFET